MTDIQDVRNCLKCGNPLTEGRTDRKFCSDTCRKAFSRNSDSPDNSPDNSADKLVRTNRDSGQEPSPASPASKANGFKIGEKAPDPEDMMKRSGKLTKTVAFAAQIFAYYLKVQIQFNEFFERYEIFDEGRWRRLTDRDFLTIRYKTGEMYNDEFGPTMTAHACELLGNQNLYDPLVEALSALQWDGIPRVDSWLETYLGVSGDQMAAQKGRRFLIGAVSRAMIDLTSAGSKVDTALVLVGGQGTRKSTTFRILAEALVPGSFLDDYHFDMNAKETLEQTSGKFIVESAEMRSFNSRDRSHVKQSLSKQSDKARMAYDRIVTEKPRRFVTVGTSNEDDFLEDATGSRRFWIVTVGEIDLVSLERDAGQLWAEAKVLWGKGEKWWLDVEEEAKNDQQNLSFMSDDPWANILYPHLGTEAHGVMTTEGVTKLLGIPFVDCDTGTSKRIARVMKQLGFGRGRVSIGERRVRGYIRGTHDPRGTRELVDTSNLIVMERGKVVKKRDETIL